MNPTTLGPTESLRRAMTQMLIATIEHNHNFIGTVHLLQGIVREQNSVAVQVLRAHGIEPAAVDAEVTRSIGQGVRLSDERPELTDSAKRVFKLSMDEARKMGHRQVGTRHLLAALLRTESGIALNILHRFGLTLAQVRAENSRQLTSPNVQSRTPQPTVSGERSGHLNPPHLRLYPADSPLGMVARQIVEQMQRSS